MPRCGANPAVLVRPCILEARSQKPEARSQKPEARRWKRGLTSPAGQHHHRRPGARGGLVCSCEMDTPHSIRLIPMVRTTRLLCRVTRSFVSSCISIRQQQQQPSIVSSSQIIHSTVRLLAYRIQSTPHFTSRERAMFSLISFRVIPTLTTTSQLVNLSTRLITDCRRQLLTPYSA